MAETELESFNDPALRAAVRQVWADERAPFELRQQIAALCPRAARPTGARKEPLSIRIRSATYGLAAAASVVLAIGLVFHSWVGGSSLHRPLRSAVLPVELADELTSSHDQQLKTLDLSDSTAQTIDTSRLAADLGHRVGVPVLAARLPGSWNLRRASVFLIGGTRAGTLVYERNGRQFVSVSSLSTGFLKGAPAVCDYSQWNHGDSIAAFSAAGGFYCLVGSSTDGSLSLAELKNLRDRIRPSIASSEPGELAVLATP